MSSVDISPVISLILCGIWRISITSKSLLIPLSKPEIKFCEVFSVLINSC
jgi:hypothetical protein